MNGYLQIHQRFDADGNSYGEEVLVPYWELDTAGVAVTLLVVKGLLSLEEGANVLHLAPAHLVSEAEAWAVAGSI